MEWPLSESDLPVSKDSEKDNEDNDGNEQNDREGLIVMVIFGAAHSHRTTFWSTSQLIEKL